MDWEVISASQVLPDQWERTRSSCLILLITMDWFAVLKIRIFFTVLISVLLLACQNILLMMKLRSALEAGKAQRKSMKVVRKFNKVPTKLQHFQKKLQK